MLAQMVPIEYCFRLCLNNKVYNCVVQSVQKYPIYYAVYNFGGMLLFFLLSDRTDETCFYRIKDPSHE